MSRDKLNDRKDREGEGKSRYAVEFRVARVPRSRVDAYLYSYSLYHTHPQILYPVSHIPEKKTFSPSAREKSLSMSMSMTSQILDLPTPIMIPG